MGGGITPGGHKRGVVPQDGRHLGILTHLCCSHLGDCILIRHLGRDHKRKNYRCKKRPPIFGLGRRPTGPGRCQKGLGRRPTGLGRGQTGLGRRPTGLGRGQTGLGRHPTGLGRGQTGLGRRPTVYTRQTSYRTRQTSYRTVCTWLPMSWMRVSRPFRSICMLVGSVSCSMASNSSFRRWSLNERKVGEEKNVGDSQALSEKRCERGWEVVSALRSGDGGKKGEREGGRGGRGGGREEGRGEGGERGGRGEGREGRGEERERGGRGEGRERGGRGEGREGRGEGEAGREGQVCTAPQQRPE